MDPDLGSWRLLSSEATFVNTGERIEHFGPKPEGLMMFTSGGRIMFLMAKSNRQPPTDDVERAASFRPEVTERSAGTHKRTSREHQAAFGRLLDAILSGRNVSRFSVVCSSAAQI